MIEDLQKAINRTKVVNAERLKARYKYARSLGFNSCEAGKLANCSVKRIQKIAEEKNSRRVVNYEGLSKQTH